MAETTPIRADPSACPRLQHWERVEQVADGDVVDVGFGEHHPKEPAAAHHAGTVYVACAVWDNYFPPSDKEVVLLAGESPAGPFEQVSQVTASAEDNHAPGILVEDGAVWVFYSRDPKDTDGVDNDIRVKSAPVGDVPGSADGWTDHGAVFEDARDPGVVQTPAGAYHLFAKDERGEGVVRGTAPEPGHAFSDRRTVYTDGMGEAPDVIPKSAGDGYWIVTAEGVGEGPRLSVAGEADSVSGTFKGYYALGTHCSLNGIRKPFHRQWTLHHDYLFGSGGRQLHRTDDHVVAYFEAGDGSRFSVGVGYLRDTGSPPEEWESDR